MQVVFHIGAHCTGHDRLVRSLLKNRDVLAEHGIAVPGPGRYRRVLSEALQRLRGARATPEAQDVLLEAVLDTDTAERVILSNESFVCMAAKVLEDGALYARIGKSAWLRNAFPGAEPIFAMSLRNVATFLPALYDLLGGEVLDPDAFLGGLDPLSLSWVPVIRGLREANPKARILVWCDEDSPILWPEIMRELCGLDPTVALDGANDMARKILSPEGARRMRAYMHRTPPENEMTRRRVVESFLERYGDEAEIEQEISLPGWTEMLIEDLTEAYDDDVDEIAEIPGVTVLSP